MNAHWKSWFSCGQDLGSVVLEESSATRPYKVAHPAESSQSALRQSPSNDDTATTMSTSTTTTTAYTLPEIRVYSEDSMEGQGVSFCGGGDALASFWSPKGRASCSPIHPCKAFFCSNEIDFESTYPENDRKRERLEYMRAWLSETDLEHYNEGAAADHAALYEDGSSIVDESSR